MVGISMVRRRIRTIHESNAMPRFLIIKRRPLMLSFDLVLVLFLTSCDEVSDITSNVINSIRFEAIAVVEQSQGFEGPSSNAYSMVGSQQLTEHQVLSPLYLSWPQSYGAMSSLLGSPTTRDGQYDYYTIPNGNQLAILYNSSGMATGYSLGDLN